MIFRKYGIEILIREISLPYLKLLCGIGVLNLLEGLDHIKRVKVVVGCIFCTYISVKGKFYNNNCIYNYKKKYRE